MKTFKFDFNVDAWIQEVEIDAENYEEAKEKLLQMSLQELVENGYIKDFGLKQIDYEVEEY